MAVWKGPLPGGSRYHVKHLEAGEGLEDHVVVLLVGHLRITCGKKGMIREMQAVKCHINSQSFSSIWCG